MKKTKLVLALLLSAMAGCDVEDVSIAGDGVMVEPLGEAAQASSTNVVAVRPVTRLVQTPGDLYFTSGKTVFRTSKSSTPGAEVALHTEPSPGPTVGALTVASVGGASFVYFLVDHGASVQIKRVSATGGAATLLATAPGTLGSLGPGAIDSDGTWLFWSDSAGIHRMAIGGGAIVTRTTDTPTTIDHDATDLYYPRGNALKRVGKIEGVAWECKTTLDWIGDASVHAVGGATTIYYGDAQARVASVAGTGGTSTLYQGPAASRTTTSVDFDGLRILWADCDTATGGTCAVRKRSGGVTTTIATGLTGVDRVVGDTSAMFYADSGRIVRHVH